MIPTGYDEDGETLNISTKPGDGLVISYRIHRILPAYYTDRGFSTPGMMMVLDTTQGDFAFYMTRREAAQFMNDIRECVSDG